MYLAFNEHLKSKLFVIGGWIAGCLYYICKALEKDIGYSKGWVLKEKIFEEQPCLRRDSIKLFSKL